MKKAAKQFITAVLAWQLRRLRRRRRFQVVAVAGSIGKTSTKFAIAQLLGMKYRVQYQEGNYNVPLTLPLVFFGQTMPSLLNPLGWFLVFLRNELKLLRPYPFDVVVVELGTDGPGQLAEFGSMIHADIGVLTAIAPEHMENFPGMADVAREELVIESLSTILVTNGDLVRPEHIPQRPKSFTYGITHGGTYHVTGVSRFSEGYAFTITKSGQVLLQATHPSVAIMQLYSVAAAVAVADQLGCSRDEIATGIARITSVSGRMQLLKGVRDSIIIDETYNASPEAMKAALEALYDMPGKQKIALLGNMNELGGFSASAHADVGAQCDPDQLACVVTLGPDANNYLAAAAEKRGCKVERTDSPYKAAEIIKSVMTDNAVILVKGSQNNVFAEETVKLLLANPADATKLIRQSKFWMRRKAKSFPASSAV